MIYREALIYDSDGTFRGYSILAPSGKLKSTNIWTEDEGGDLQAQIERLNTDVALREYWPRLDDPDVQALIHDDEWLPAPHIPVTEDELVVFAQLRTRKAMETIARKRAALEA